MENEILIIFNKKEKKRKVMKEYDDYPIQKIATCLCPRKHNKATYAGFLHPE